MKRNALLAILLGVIIIVLAVVARNAGLCDEVQGCSIGNNQATALDKDDSSVSLGESLVDGDVGTGIVESIDLLSQAPDHPDIRLTELTHYLGTIGAPVAGFSFEGEAKGFWFFEGDFPVSLVDGNGEEVAIKPVRAKGEWMTTGFVFFQGILEYRYYGDAPNGHLIIRRDNPSDNGDLDDELRIPVTLQTQLLDIEGSPRTRSVEVFFIPPHPDLGFCGDVSSVFRTMPYIQAIGTEALRELFRGLTPAEQAQGYATAFESNKVELVSLRIQDGIAYANIKNLPSGGSCKVLAARAQIEQTLFQFPTVNEVRIGDENGNTEAVLQP